MPVPKFFEFFSYFLKALQDGKLHNVKEVRSAIAIDMKLTDKDLTEMLPSGQQTTFENRIAWARTYLNKAGLIETPSRGHYRITEEGIKALSSQTPIDLAFLENYQSFKDFHNKSKKSLQSEEGRNDKSPIEILESAYKQVNNTLADEIMEEIMKLTPTEFERLVVKLLLKMGYGSGIDDAGMVTQQSNDGGIDGIIKEDQLGFSHIYIQAKQWAPNQTVGAPEIQKFVGALQGQQAQKGLFITTAKFSNKALQYAQNLLGAKVVLVDQTLLPLLMIKHNVGVSIEQIYEVKRIDSDFFSEEL